MNVGWVYEMEYVQTRRFGYSGNGDPDLIGPGAGRDHPVAVLQSSRSRASAPRANSAAGR